MKVKRFLKKNMFNIPFAVLLIAGICTMSTLEVQAEIEKAETKEIVYELTVQEQIELACLEHEIDSQIPLAIAKLETGHFTSKAFRQLNNVGGMSINEIPIEYATIEDGVDAFVGNLARNYFGIGLNTVEEISRKYCPVNADRWSALVNELMEGNNDTN